jgi:hypothetical protein
MIATIVNGVWEYTACTIGIPFEIASPIHFLGETTPDDLLDEITKDVGIPYFSVVVDDPIITRGVGFDLTVQALNADGSPDTAYVPTNDPIIQLIDKSDNGDNIDTVNMGKLGWVAGKKTLTGIKIAGGSGSDVAKIQVAETSGPSGATDLLPINANPTIKALTPDKFYQGSSGVKRPINAANFAAAQDDARTNFINDTSGGFGAATGEMRIQTADFFPPGCAGVFRSHVEKVFITPAEAVGVKALELELKIASTITKPSFDYSPFDYLDDLYIGSDRIIPTGGADMYAHSYKTHYTYLELNEQDDIQGGNKGTSLIKIGVDIKLLDVLQEGDTFMYLWFIQKRPYNIPFVEPFVSDYAMHLSNVDLVNLILYK